MRGSTLTWLLVALALAAAGAMETLMASPRRFALIHELDDHPEPPLQDLIVHCGNADLVLIEGFKWSPHPKLEVWDPELGKSMLAPTEPTVVAIAADLPVADIALPRYCRDDADGIATFIAAYCQLPARTSTPVNRAGSSV